MKKFKKELLKKIERLDSNQLELLDTFVDDTILKDQNEQKNNKYISGNNKKL